MFGSVTTDEVEKQQIRSQSDCGVNYYLMYKSDNLDWQDPKSDVKMKELPKSRKPKQKYVAQASNRKLRSPD